MIPSFWKRRKGELKSFLDFVADQIREYTPETDTLTPEAIEGILTQIVPNLPWASVPTHGPVFEAALSTHTAFYARELYRRFQAASSKSVKAKLPIDHVENYINLLTSDGAEKAIANFDRLNQEPKNAILLSKHVSSEFFTRLYQEAPKQTATGESSAIVWAKRVCNLLLADKTDVDGRIKSFLNIISPYVQEVVNNSLLERTEELYRVILDFISLCNMQTSVKKQEAFEKQFLNTSLANHFARVATLLDHATQSSTSSTSSLTSSSISPSARAAKDFAVIISLLGEPISHLEKLTAILYVIGILL